mmetsp:Transcript_8847/g.20476  ORF Transcript_8847/g.20476 Transcript_8847/m.20476 type:complete len:226 (+) Transcript_8847:148-825(+)
MEGLCLDFVFISRVVRFHHERPECQGMVLWHSGGCHDICTEFGYFGVGSTGGILSVLQGCGRQGGRLHTTGFRLVVDWWCRLFDPSRWISISCYQYLLFILDRLGILCVYPGPMVWFQGYSEHSRARRAEPHFVELVRVVSEQHGGHGVGHSFASRALPRISTDRLGLCDCVGNSEHTVGLLLYPGPLQILLPCQTRRMGGTHRRHFHDCLLDNRVRIFFSCKKK